MATFGRHFGLGIGSGYLLGRSRGDLSLNHTVVNDYSWGSSTETKEEYFRRSYKVSAIPIRFTFYYFLPRDSLIFYGFGGLGLYMGNLRDDISDDDFWNVAVNPNVEPDEQAEFTTSFAEKESAKATALGFHGGLGLKTKLWSQTELALELFGRLVHFGDWTGDWASTQEQRQRLWKENEGWYSDRKAVGSAGNSGTLWIFKNYFSAVDNYYTEMLLARNMPTGAYSLDARKAAINLNTIGLAVSIIFHLDFFK
jgi:hypothetical protein